jgi:hypothetical protein
LPSTDSIIEEGASSGDTRRVWKDTWVVGVTNTFIAAVGSFNVDESAARPGRLLNLLTQRVPVLGARQRHRGATDDGFSLKEGVCAHARDCTANSS